MEKIERENIRTQMMAGREQKAKEGKWNGGFAPYGYTKKLRQNNTMPGFSSSFVKSVLDNLVYMGKIAYGRRRTEKKCISWSKRSFRYMRGVMRQSYLKQIGS